MSDAYGYWYLHAERIAFDDLPETSLVREFGGYWHTVSPPDGLPKRSDVDPVRIGAKLLPWLFLMDVERHGDDLDYHYRLVGTENAELVGRDATGRKASDIFGTSERRFVMESFHATVREAGPTYWRAIVPQDRTDSVKVYRGLFPFVNDKDVVDLLVGLACPD